MSSSAPLNYESSAGQTNLSVSSTLPNEVVDCLKHARFLHLATCTSDLHPHVSLMNYTYLPSTPWSSTPAIIMTTNPSSRKTQNLISNPNVSLLVHDWVSQRRTPALTAGSDSLTRSSSPPPSSLALLLANLNTSALSSISATINGVARLVESGTEEEVYLRGMHVDNNTFEDGEGGAGLVGGLIRRESLTEQTGDGGRGAYVQGEGVRVLVVGIKDGRVADWKGNVRDWRLEAEPTSAEPVRTEGGSGHDVLVNGI